MYMEAGSAGELAAGMAWSKSDSGESCWSIRATTRAGSDQAMDKILAAQPLKVPVMLVHSLWDQEDIYGAHRGLQGDQAEGHK